MTEELTPITFASTLLDHNNKIWETQRVVRDVQQAMSQMASEVNKLMAEQHKKIQALEAKCSDLEQIILSKLSKSSDEEESSKEEDIDTNEIM